MEADRLPGAGKKERVEQRDERRDLHGEHQKQREPVQKAGPEKDDPADEAAAEADRPPQAIERGKRHAAARG